MKLLAKQTLSPRCWGLAAPGIGWDRLLRVGAAAASPLLQQQQPQQQQLLLQQRRFLHLHEYQSMELMHKYNVSVPAFRVARTKDEAFAAAQQLQQQLQHQQQQQQQQECPLIVKAQVLAGGRGLGHFRENGFQGGVHACNSAAEAAELASHMLGKTLITKQTGGGGKPCSVVLLAERFNTKREMYLALLLDRASRGPVLVGSARGGTSIEDIAAKYPEAIVKVPLDVDTGVTDEALEKLAVGMQISSPSQKEELFSLVHSLYRLFTEKDCLLVEINPLVEAATAGSSSSSSSSEGTLRVCDAKLAFDDNAGYRHKDLLNQRDKTQEDPGELAAEEEGLNYIKLQNGQIGCMVNGAGLAMASMDLIQLKGLSPANFLDVGGGANEKKIVAALSIIQKDKDAKAVFVNIFGGIMRCDVIARGLITAIRETGFSKPMVIRLEGTNKEEAERLLAAEIGNSKPGAPQIQAVSGFDEAAEAVVQLANSL
ncbi:hypothetical protein Efla_003880 [Eimeria flavescens]